MVSICSMRRFFIEPEKFATDMPIITGADAAHISQVLRYKIGDIIGLFDGRGGEYEAEIIALDSENVRVAILQRFTAEKESVVEITVAQGILKEKKMDVVVRQLSEIGAMRWVPFRAKRSVAVPNAVRIAARKTRWEKIAVEAAKQCGRNRVMTIEPADTFDQMLERYANCDHRVVFWEKATRSVQYLQTAASHRPGARVIIILGPEGGFDPAEIQTAQAKGFDTFGLGPRILRAETAAIAACTLVQYIFGDMGQQSA